MRTWRLVLGAWMTLVGACSDDDTSVGGAGGVGAGGLGAGGQGGVVTTGGGGGQGGASVSGGGGSGGSTQLPEVYPVALTTDATHLYWLDRGCADSGTEGRVVKRPLAGGADVVLSDGHAGWELKQIGLDSDHVYWTGGRAVRRVPIAGGSSETVLSVVGLHDVGAFAVDSTGVYWADTNYEAREFALKRTVVDGTFTTTTLATGQGSGGISALAVANDQVYWTNYANGTVMSVPITGGAQQMVASAQFRPGPIAVDGTSVYWSNQGNEYGSYPGAVMKLPLAGGEPVELFSGVTARALSVVGPDLVWTTRNAVMKGSAAGGDRFLLADASPVGLAIGGTNAYWGVYGGSHTSPCTPAGAIGSAPLDGGDMVEPAPPVSSYSDPVAMAVDATHVYWVDHFGSTVMKQPIGGGAQVQLANAAAPGSIAIDASWVYWTNENNGAVMKVPLGGGTPVAVAVAQYKPGGLALNGSAMSWLTTPSLFTASLGGGAPDELGPVSFTVFCGSPPAATAISSMNVYWIDLAADCTPTLMTRPIAGGPATPFAGGQVHPSYSNPSSSSSFAIDATNVYWGTSGAIWSLPLAGGTPVQLASGSWSPTAITVDATHVYFNSPGPLMKVPIAGGPATQLAVLEPGDAYRTIAVDATSVYWMRPGDPAQVMSAPK